MGQQHRKEVKRKRRKQYVKRKRAQVREEVAARPRKVATTVKKSADKAEKSGEKSESKDAVPTVKKPRSPAKSKAGAAPSAPVADGKPAGVESRGVGEPSASGGTDAVEPPTSVEA